MKGRKRYILFEVIADESLVAKDVAKAILQRANAMLGEIGMAKSEIKMLSDTWKDNKGVLCVDHRFVDEARSILMSVTQINGKRLTITTLRTSGVINKLKI